MPVSLRHGDKKELRREAAARAAAPAAEPLFCELELGKNEDRVGHGRVAAYK